MPLPANVTDLVNAHRGGFEDILGLVFLEVTEDLVVAQVTLTEQHKQPYGLVHGGVYAAMVETVCSVGAGVNALVDGRSTVGLDNHTSFLRAVRGGRLTARAEPVTKGRRTHVWRAEIRGDDGRLAATGQVRVLCLEAGSAVAGQTVALRGTD